MCNYGVAKKKLHSVQGVDQRGKDSTPWKTNQDSLVKAFVQGDCHDTHCEIWKCELRYFINSQHKTSIKSEKTWVQCSPNMLSKSCTCRGSIYSWVGCSMSPYQYTTAQLATLKRIQGDDKGVATTSTMVSWFPRDNFKPSGSPFKHNPSTHTDIKDSSF